MVKITLDTNCLIDLDEDRANAAAVRRLTAACRDESISVALAASSATERQKDGSSLQNLRMFDERLKDLGLSHLQILPSLGRRDMDFWDAAVWAGPAELKLEQEILCILFPSYAAIGSDDLSRELETRRGRNRLMDARAFWAHAVAERDIFVTSDENFLKKEAKLSAIYPGRIMKPADAVDAVFG